MSRPTAWKPGIGEYIAKQLYPNKPVDQLTESEKQTISALSTLAGGLAGGLAAGGLNNAIAAAGTAKNAVENNHLSPIEDASLEVMRKEYNSSCVGVSSDECTKLKADIEALFKKAQSILKDETISLASDATWDSKQDHKPGDIVMCKTSYTSFCVVTDQSVKTADGNEWYLKPATVEQALEGRANQEKMTSDTIASLKQIAVDSFNEGCGGSLGIGIVCQLSMAFGVTNPVTEAKATTGERIGWFAQALLNIVGLKAAVGGAGAKGSSIVDAEKDALDRIAQNPKGPDLTGKQPGAILQQQSDNRISDLASQYNNSSLQPKDFQLSIGGKTLQADPYLSVGAPVYSGTTTSDVMSYFRQLTGTEYMPVVKSIPGKGDVYAATITSGANAGSKITLRNFSNSTQQSGATWTIDVINPSINAGKRIEIKFK
ncbi:VENN motif pre-toxin domain-containing protein [Pseudomonas sp. S1_G07]